MFKFFTLFTIFRAPTNELKRFNQPLINPITDAHVLISELCYNIHNLILSQCFIGKSSMTKWQSQFDVVDTRITTWMARYGVVILRVSLGVIFFWFGVLKFFPALSPAEELAAKTIELLSFGIIKPAVSVPVLAAWETAIGLGLITGRFMRVTLALLGLQMLGTVTPLFLFTAETWRVFPIALTLEGQYIVKNLVLVSAGLVIGATVRGGAMVADPDLAEEAKTRYQQVRQQQVHS